MAGNSQRRGAMRNEGSKKGMQVGSGGQRRKALKGKGPTPKAVERPHHPAAKRKRAAEKRAAKSTTSRGGSRGKNASSELLFGRNSVLEALLADIPVISLSVQQYVDSDDRIKEIMTVAADRGLPIMEVSKLELERMSDGGNHQGVALRVPAYEYVEADDLMHGASTLIVALDGVTDPRNLGAIARSAAGFRADGVLIPERRAAGVTAAAWKTSAGALARVPVARTVNLTRALKAYQKAGCTVIGLAADATVALDALDVDVVSGPIVLVVGSEGKGLSRLVAEACDWTVSIPMDSATESLNASVAAGISLYAISTMRSARR